MKKIANTPLTVLNILRLSLCGNSAKIVIPGRFTRDNAMQIAALRGGFSSNREERLLVGCDILMHNVSVIPHRSSQLRQTVIVLFIPYAPVPQITNRSRV